MPRVVLDTYSARMYNVAMKRSSIFLSVEDHAAAKLVQKRYHLPSESDALRFAVHLVAEAGAQPVVQLPAPPADYTITTTYAVLKEQTP